ncbi:glycosyltransferase family 2 protein [Bdellovibrio sp. HCB337]|uniref:glycosyltransferase family 2 protein n=1 Tax=Bdellovibrio sp. HCB337 TaxID=3394358 RepID=UPI0039A5C6D1
MSNPTLSIVIPCYNEESNIAQIIHRFDQLASQLPSFELLFVDDGSKDKTVEQIQNYKNSSHAYNIRLLRLSRNFGHQLALLAGMRNSIGEICITIDADMQDPPEVIPAMIKAWKEGHDVVLGQRNDRAKDTWFKRTSAVIFYRIMTVLARGDFPANVGDFRLVSKKVLDVLRSLPEQSPYWRGIVVWVGFKRTFVEYSRAERFSGETKYPFIKMVTFALDALFSFSKKPLLFVTYSGFALCVVGAIFLLTYISLKVTGYAFVPGWTSIISLVMFIGGFQILCLGVIGQYIGRIYEQVLGRPQVLHYPAEDVHQARR